MCPGGPEVAPLTHLKSLQALEMALRTGSLKAAAERLGITPAAVGQRIRAIEERLGTVLLERGPAGLRAAPELDAAIADLTLAFEALERATLTLDIQREADIHIVADPDWAELWLQPRIAAFRAEHPNIRFCINGEGDVPLRLGSPDLRVTCDDGPGEALYSDVFLPVTGPDNTRRIADGPPDLQMEGMPLLHLKAQRDRQDVPGWVAWCRSFGQREKGADRGVTYPNARLALTAVRTDVGFLVCGLSFLLADLATGTVVLPFPATQHIRAPHPYRLWLREGAGRRPQVARFLSWLRDASDTTARDIDRWVRPGRPGVGPR